MSLCYKKDGRIRRKGRLELVLVLVLFLGLVATKTQRMADLLHY